MGPGASFVCPISHDCTFGEGKEGGGGCCWCFPPFCLYHRKTLQELLSEGGCKHEHRIGEDTYYHVPGYLHHNYEELLRCLNEEELIREAEECVLDFENHGDPYDPQEFSYRQNYSNVRVVEGVWESMPENEKGPELPLRIRKAFEKVERIRKERKDEAARRGSETRSQQGQTRKLESLD